MTLSISQLTCAYGKQPIVTGLDLSLEQGNILCLLGASGCGKTTVLKAISGLVNTPHGQISLAENQLLSDDICLAPQQRNVGMIFQDYALFPHLTVAQNILFGVSHLAKVDQAIVLERMLNLVGLAGYEKRLPQQLSGGQQQRVAIARALAPEPDLLLMDEPFSNLDQQLKLPMIEEIRKILKSQNITCVFVTHNRDEAFAFSDQIAVMEAGKIIQQGSPKVLYSKPVNRFVAEALGPVNVFHGEVENQKIRLDNAVIHGSQLSIEQKEELALYQDRPIKLLIRPQFIIALPSQNSHLVVKRKVFMGEQEYLEVSDGKYSYTAEKSPTVHYAEGDKVHLDVLPHNLVLV